MSLLQCHFQVQEKRNNKKHAYLELALYLCKYYSTFISMIKNQVKNAWKSRFTLFFLFSNDKEKYKPIKMIGEVYNEMQFNNNPFFGGHTSKAFGLYME